MGLRKNIKINKRYDKSLQLEDFWDDCGFNNHPFHYSDEQIVKHFMSTFNKTKVDLGCHQSWCTFRQDRYISETALDVLDRQPTFAYVLTLWEDISNKTRRRNMDNSTVLLKTPPSLISSCVSKIPDFRRKNKLNSNKTEPMEIKQCDNPKKEFHDILQFWKKMEE